MAKKPSRAKAADLVAPYRTLSDVNRFRAIDLLQASKGGLLVGDIAEALDMGHSAVSHLLGFLNEGGIVKYAKSGRTVRYTLASTPEAKRLLRIKRAG